MKHFVFFADTIKRVGGAQLYIKAKALYLTAAGWDVNIVYHQNGEPCIDDLQNYDNLYCPELYQPSYYYTNCRRKHIIKKLCGFVDFRGEMIVYESHSRKLASWAEVLAKVRGDVKHVCYDLGECINVPVPMFEFYKFKYERQELFGIQSASIALFFKGTNIQLKYGSPCLPAYGASDCVADCKSDLIEDTFNGYVIGIVGRLEKAYIWEYAKSIKKFASNHADRFFTLVFVGGAPENENPEVKIRQLYKECSNIKLIFTGYIFPIPRILVTSFNICLAGAGAASAISREGVVTISIDPRDFLANGILGITTHSSTFSEGEKKTVLWWLEEVYNHNGKYKVSKSELRYDFKTHMDVLVGSKAPFCYNTSFLEYKKTFRERITMYFNSLFPISIREKVANVVRKAR